MLSQTSKLGLASVCLTALASQADAQLGVNLVRVATGVSNPTQILAPAGDERLFVLEQNQTDIEVLLPTGPNSFVKDTAPFLDLNAALAATGAVGVSTGGERGLLGMAFHPNYKNNGEFFLWYTGTSGNTRLDRWKVDPTNPNRADINSREQLFVVAQPFSNHNGGMLAFGPDGYLYISTGDGGSGNDPGCRAQDGQSLLGKMLRIDVDNKDAGLNYAIPATNPFVGDPAVLDEVLHLGLRNPWRFSFDRLTGEMWIGDVGQDAREEISYAPANATGLNFGWRIFEGNLCNGQGSCPTAVGTCATNNFEPAIAEYSHAGGFGGPCTVVGGYVYRGSEIPSIYGRYFYIDYCDNVLRSFEWDGVATSNPVQGNAAALLSGAGTVSSIATFGEDGFGELYAARLNNSGEIFKFVPTGAPGTAQPLQAIYNEFSVTEGGLQQFTLDAGPSFAGDLYFILGSTSGTTPGIDVDGLNLPLNVDSYLLDTLNNPNAIPMIDSLGFLDGDGQATALWSLPAGVLGASEVGVVANHAALVLDLAFGNVTFTSNAVSLTLAD
jgi:glucose/arabinose dehydrogenase